MNPSLRNLNVMFNALHVVTYYYQQMEYSFILFVFLYQVGMILPYLNQCGKRIRSQAI